MAEAEPRRLRIREDEVVKLRSISSISDFTVVSADGDVGPVHEYLFDDSMWAIRYVAVNADYWLPGMKVLLSPLALDEPDWEMPKFTIATRKEELKRAQHLRLDEPVTRSFQIMLYQQYGWLPYWLEEEYYDVLPSPSEVKSEQTPEKEKEIDPHLFATGEMFEYRIEALDGEIGSIVDFIIDQDDWMIHYFVVALDENLPEIESSKSVLISTEWVQRIVRDEEKVYIDLDKEKVENSPEYDPAVPLDREYELVLYDHYGRPRYWLEGDMEEDNLR